MKYIKYMSMAGDMTDTDTETDTSAPFAAFFEGACIEESFGDDIKFTGTVKFAWFHQPLDKPNDEEK